MIKQDISENLVKIVYLGIGSNLGNRNNNIEKTKFKLQNYQIKILKCSSNYESESWPNPNNPKFINIIIKIQTNEWAETGYEISAEKIEFYDY